ncbi:MAG: TetR/AcrR family transcriptional regulator [Myxococcota bacterium]
MGAATLDVEATRHRVLRVAAALFRARGYAGVSMRAIAQDCGMTAGSLYHHFSSKEDIVVEVLDRGHVAVHEGVGAALEQTRGRDGARRFRAAVEGHLLALHQNTDFASANVRIFGQVPPDVRARNLGPRLRYEKLWDDFLEELKGSGTLKPSTDVKMVRLLVLGALNATLEWFDPARGSIEDLAATYGNLLLHGAAGEAPSSS